MSNHNSSFEAFRKGNQHLESIVKGAVPIPLRGEAALRTHLKPLEPWLEANGVTEISINRPREVWTAHQGEAYMRQHIAPAIGEEVLLELARQVATHTKQEVNSERPLLSAELPNGYRVQFVLPPAAKSVTLSIRKPGVLDMNLDDYQRRGAFDQTNRQTKDSKETEDALQKTYENRDFAEFLKVAITTRKNILISAGTDTGKTTLLNALLKEIPVEERLVIIEDANELKPMQANVVRLFYSRGSQGLAKVTAQDLCEASLRLRPDRILLGELRGAEAFTYLRTINSGHPGSITTIHADSPELAFDQLALMVIQAFPGMDRKMIIDYVKSIIPVVVQAKRFAGNRFISDIYYAGPNTAVLVS